jgi:hypothetical protein
MKQLLDFLKNPEKRFLFELAEKLGRTVAELLHGSSAHRPLTSMELTEWSSLWSLRAKEQEKADKKAKAKGRR